MTTTERDPQDVRRDALRDLIEKVRLDLNRSYSGAEDIQPYLDGEEEIHPWAVVTRSSEDGDWVYIYPDYDNKGDAKLRGIEFINDSLFSEYPEMIVNLDTGERFHPRYEELQWTDDDTTVVVCTRDPDSANCYETFGPSVEIVDLDLGYMDLGDSDEGADWAEGHLRQAKDFRDMSRQDVADYIESTVKASVSEESYARAMSALSDDDKEDNNGD